MPVAAGIGMAVIMEALDQSIRSEQGLAAVTGVPPLVSIPYIKNPSEQENSRPGRLFFVFVGVTTLLLVIALVAINYLYKPLDVLLYMALPDYP